MLCCVVYTVVTFQSPMNEAFVAIAQAAQDRENGIDNTAERLGVSREEFDDIGATINSLFS